MKNSTELLKKKRGPRQQIVGSNGLRYRVVGDQLVRIEKAKKA